MKVSQQKVDALLKSFEENIPNFQIIYKEDADWYKANWKLRVIFYFITVIGIFSPLFKHRFLTEFANGIGNFLLLPDRERYSNFTKYGTYGLLRHEYVHMLDYINNPIWFVLSYIAVLPAFFTFRAFWEIRGYTQNMIVAYEETGEIRPTQIEYIADHFSSSMYFWMWSSRKNIIKVLYAIKGEIESGKISGFYPDITVTRLTSY